MDILGKIVQGNGCAVDGTVAAQNPLSKALDNVLQSQARVGHARGPMNGPPPPARMAMQMQRNNFARGADAQMMQQFEQEAMHRAQMEAAFRAGEGKQGAMMHHPHHASMEAAFNEARHMHPPPGAHYGPMHPGMHHPQHHAPPPRALQDAWVNDFQSMHLDDAWGAAGKSHQELAWEETKASVPYHHEARFAQHQSQHMEVATQEADSRKVQTMQASSDMARTMSQNPDPKWQNSEFLKFMNQVSSGEVELDEEKNAVRAEGALEGAWGDSDDGDVRVNRDLYESSWAGSANPAAATMEQAFQDVGPAQARSMENAWDDSREAESKFMANAWNDSRTEEEKNMDAAWGDADSLEAMWEKAMAEAKTTDPFEDVWDTVNDSNEYVYKADNPFMEQSENFQRGVKFFESGHLTDAILAFEAEVQQQPENSEAWRMLGECHAENDEDKSAIICLERAVEEDPYNLSALLALGVSNVNELNPQGALKNLKAWVQHNPKFHGLEIQLDEYSDGSLMDEVMQLMLQARAHDPADSDVQVVLGVLYNVSKDYDAAVSSFQSASSVRPTEYSLWNKLGATLANSSRSSEAIPAYHRALELKPRYARGWLNLGISHANLGNYEEATKCYLQALSLNDRADHIWSYLRICFTCMERFDLVKLSDTRDINLFRDEFKLLELQ
ncbi:hypothetical protein Poli38472_004262 [Pythium oligandrum]|uniref:Peroxin-5 n=1 Tax=Pythium oligandrum TaxID=41045 RepID=A0A8K1FP33_PYTOL|nr:hypothetical protein Poli38472_004262 [Pythium oligandrum]|eukprot:TMW66497.1 hypothetical protein Poli38472_004262 [Pythium oligandrum]